MLQLLANPLPSRVQLSSEILGETRTQQVHACVYPLCPFLSLPAGGQPRIRLFLPFLFVFRKNESVDCETVLETKSYKSCGVFMATSVSQVAWAVPGFGTTA